MTPDDEVRYCVDEGHPDGYECPPDCPGVFPADCWDEGSSNSDNTPGREVAS